MRVSLIGGPFDGSKASLRATPVVIHVGSHAYERIDDPDTGDALGGYVWLGRVT